MGKGLKGEREVFKWFRKKGLREKIARGRG